MTHRRQEDIGDNGLPNSMTLRPEVGEFTGSVTCPRKGPMGAGVSVYVCVEINTTSPHGCRECGCTRAKFSADEAAGITKRMRVDTVTREIARVDRAVKHYNHARAREDTRRQRAEHKRQALVAKRDAAAHPNDVDARTDVASVSAV